MDDEPEFVKILTVAFQVYRPGYSLVAAYDGMEALAKADTEEPAVVVLDVMLPDIDGLEVCRRLRSRSGVPILLLTARDREDDVVQGFEAGADDYITKPFSYRTLMARIDALLRRAGLAPASERPGILSCGELVVDFVRRQVRLHGQTLDLTPKEYRILEELARHTGQLVSHQALLARVWGDDYRDEPQYLKTYVYRLRRKIEDDPHHPRYILTHYGDGYYLAKEDQDGPAASAGAPEAGLPAQRRPRGGER
ncbi:MAG: response regulator transcription factor [Chloroflexi bacterium]|nr:response regulator transcription factor [Chloroflexota bacterium]